LCRRPLCRFVTSLSVFLLIKILLLLPSPLLVGITDDWLGRRTCGLTYPRHGILRCCSGDDG